MAPETCRSSSKNPDGFKKYWRKPEGADSVPPGSSSVNRLVQLSAKISVAVSYVNGRHMNATKDALLVHDLSLAFKR